MESKQEKKGEVVVMEEEVESREEAKSHARAIAAKRAAMIAKLDLKKPTKRQIVQGLAEESGPLFTADFQRKRAELLAACAKKEEEFRKGGTNQSELDQWISSLRSEVSELQSRTAEKARYLVSFDLQQSQTQTQELFAECDRLQNIFTPKKKFAFKKSAAAAGGGGKSHVDHKKNVADNAPIVENVEFVPSANSIGFRNREGETIYLPPASVEGKDMWLSNCTTTNFSCEDVSAALRIHNVQDCRVYVGPIKGSAHIENATNCIFIIAARQVRIHNSTNCVFMLGVASGPIIEDCNNLSFGRYSLEYPMLKEHLLAAGLLEVLSEQGGKWNDVQDFKWLKSTHSPNWVALPDQEQKIKYSPITE